MTPDEIDIERFFAKTTPEPMSGCLLWTGAIMKNGYGRFKLRHGNVENAHRVALAIDGRAPVNKQVAMHLCNNRACVNVTHLRPGSQRENLEQAARQGRMNNGPRKGGEESAVARLTWEAVRQIRSAFKAGARKSELAKRYDVSWSCVDFIIRGTTWREHDEGR